MVRKLKKAKQERAVMLRRREIVADLYVLGWYQADIARHVGVSQPTVSNDLKAIQKEWRQSAIRDFDVLRERELKKLDRLEREAWDAWDRSKKPAQQAVVNTSGEMQSTQKKVTEQVGDPRYLEQISKCIASRRALLGLDAPAKIAPTSPDGEQPYHAYVMAELMRLSEHVSAGPDIIDAEFIRTVVERQKIDQNDSQQEQVDRQSNGRG